MPQLQREKNIGDVVDESTMDRMYTTDSVDKKIYASRDPFTRVANIPSKQTTTYMTNFVTDVAENALYRRGVLGTAQMIARSIRVWGALLKEGQTLETPTPIGDVARVGVQALGLSEEVTKDIDAIVQMSLGILGGTQPDSFAITERIIAHGTNLSGGEYKQEIFGEQLVNYGLYLTDSINDHIAQRDLENPIDAPGALFVSDVGGSILSMMAVYAITKDPLLTSMVLSGESGMDATIAALDNGYDPKFSVAYGILVGLGSTALEMFGLKRVMAKTAETGIKQIIRAIMHVMKTEAPTEAAQTVLEIASQKLVGGLKDVTLLDAIGQTIYAAGVGAFAGGSIYGVRAIRARGQAIKLLKILPGVDTAKATQVVDEGMRQEQQRQMDSGAQETGFDTTINSIYQAMRNKIKIFLGDATISQEQVDMVMDDLRKGDPLVDLLTKIRVQETADVNTEILEGGIKGKAIGQGRQVKAANEFLNRKKLVKDTKIPDYKRIVSTIDTKLGKVYKATVVGRLRFLKGELQKMAKTIIAKGDSKGAVGKQKMKQLEKFSAMLMEYDAIRMNPNNVNINKKGKIVLDTTTMQRLGLNQLRTIVSNVKRNFKAGERAIKQDIQYINSVVNSMLKIKGLNQNQRNSLKLWAKNNISKPVTLRLRIGEIEARINTMIEQNLSEVYQNSINRMVKILKGKGRGIKRGVNLNANEQRLADIFTKEFNNIHTDPGNFKNTARTPENTMKAWGSQLQTGYSLNGEILSVLDYQSIENGMRRFIELGTLDFARQQEIKKRAQESALEMIRKEVKTSIEAPVSDTRKIMETVLAPVRKYVGNYRTLLAATVSGIGVDFNSTALGRFMNVFAAERVANTVKTQYLLRLRQEGVKIFNLKNTGQYNDKIIDDSANVTGVTAVTIINPDGSIFWEGSTAMAREKYMLWVSPDGQAVMQNLQNKKKKNIGWSQDHINSLVEKIGPQNVDFVHAQLKIYEDMYIQLNEVFRRMYGYDLPKIEFYSTLLRENVNVDTMNVVDQIFGKDSQGRDREVGDISHLKSRTNNTTPLKNISDTQKMERYIKDVGHFIGMGEAGQRIQEVINDPEIKKSIVESKGIRYHSEIKLRVDALVRGSRYKDRSDLLSASNRWIGNMQQMVLAGKPILFAKQMISSAAAMDTVSPLKYVKYIKALPAAIKDGSAMGLFNDPFFVDRAVRRNLTVDMQDLSQMIEERAVQSTTEKAKKFKKAGMKLQSFMFLSTQIGDMGGVMLNGWAIYQHNLAEGMSPNEARRAAIKHIDSSQQSGSITELSSLAMSTNPLARSMTSFTHAPLQYANKVLQQLETVGTPQFNGNKFGRTFAIYFFVLPMIYKMMSRGFRVREEDTPEYMAETAIGPFGDVPLAGKMLEWMAANAAYGAFVAAGGEGNKPRAMDLRRVGTGALGLLGSILNNTQDAYDAIVEGFTDDFTVEEVFDVITEMAEASGPVGGVFSGTVRTGSNMLQGISLAIEENGNGSFVNSMQRLLMLLGYSEFATRPEEE